MEETIESCCELLEERDLLPDEIDAATFKKLCLLATTNVLLLAPDGKFHRQIDGVAMGSSLGPFLANLFMSKYEDSIKAERNVYFRYMDDIITTCKLEEVDSLLKTANELHSNLKFTHELPSEHGLPFLDISLEQCGTQIKTSWYRKPSDTGVLLNYHAVSPEKYKRSLVAGFVHRVWQTCSDYVNFDRCLKQLKTVLEMNQYPPYFYNSIVRRTLEKLVGHPGSDCGTALPRKRDILQSFFLRLQYRGKVTDHLVKKLSQSLDNCRIILVTTKMSLLLPSLKGKLTPLSRSRVIYHINCPACDAGYVGYTTRHLKTRLMEHGRTNAPVADHFEGCGVSPKSIVRNAKVIDSHISTNFLLSLEAVYIAKKRPSINTRDEYRSKDLLLKF